MVLLVKIALRHILSRKRQSIVSLLGIVIGVGFFLAISSLMQGSQNDFIARLVDNAPHITIYDEYRNPSVQPVETLFGDAIIELRSVKPKTEPRGIRHHRQIVERIRKEPGVQASSSLTGQAILSFAGRDENIMLSGMVPEDMTDVVSLAEDMVEGSIEDLIVNPDGIIVGAELMRKLSLSHGDTITLSAAGGQVRVFKIVGVFRTGLADIDTRHAYVDIKRVQALLGKPNRANTIIIKLDDPYLSRSLAERLERQFGYKAVSWQEASEDLLNTLVVRNVIMYSVVSAVLIVAAFGIYNIISTVVMEKQRDIAILKSMGFRALDMTQIFILQGALLGVAGCIAGLPFGALLMYGLSKVTMHPPGMEELQLPIDWSPPQFIVAAAFAFFAALLAAWLPARKAARVYPVDILRGGM